MSKNKTLAKRHTTGSEGVYYKAIISPKDEDKLKILYADLDEAKDEEKKAIQTKIDKLLKDKQYLIRWRDENNKERLKTIGKHSEGIREAYCKKKRDEIIVKIRLDEDLPHLAKKKSSITLDTLAYQYFNDNMTLVKDMLKKQKRYDNHIQPTLGHIKAENIKLSDIKDLRNKFMKNLANRTVNHLIFMIGTIYKYNIKNELYKGVSPTANYEGLEVDNERERYLSLEEIDKLLEACWSSSYEVWLYAKLLLSTGSRAGGVISLKASDIHLEEWTITIADHKKTKAYAESPKTYDTFISDEELHTHLIKRVSELNPNDGMFKKQRYYLDNKLKAVLDLLFNIGLPLDDRKNRAVIHTLRHTFASHLAINGEPIYNIQKLLNHKDLNSTLRYAKLNKKKKRKSVRDMYSKQKEED